MGRVHVKYDEVVGKVMYDSHGEVVTEVQVSAPITTAEDRDRKYVGMAYADEPEVTSVNLSYADSFWKGCSATPTDVRWVRSASAVEFGNRTHFMYLTEKDNVRYCRFYRDDRSHVTITIRSIVLTEDEYGQVVRYRVECWDNPASGKGKLKWVRTVDGYADLGYDRADAIGYSVQEHVTRLIMLYGAKVLYGNV